MEQIGISHSGKKILVNNFLDKSIMVQIEMNNSQYSEDDGTRTALFIGRSGCSMTVSSRST